jgi:hypothetical protein
VRATARGSEIDVLVEERLEFEVLGPRPGAWGRPPRRMLRTVFSRPSAVRAQPALRRALVVLVEEAQQGLDLAPPCQPALLKERVAQRCGRRPDLAARRRHRAGVRMSEMALWARQVGRVGAAPAAVLDVGLELRGNSKETREELLAFTASGATTGGRSGRPTRRSGSTASCDGGATSSASSPTAPRSCASSARSSPSSTTSGRWPTATWASSTWRRCRARRRR